MFKVPSSKKTGFTLIELLIYMGLLVVALTLTSSLLFQIATTDLKENTRIDIEENSRLILHHLKLEIEKARDSSLPASEGQSSLSLTLVQPDDEDADSDEEIVTFSLSGNQLVQAKDGTSNRLNSGLVGVRNLSFEKIGDSLIPSDSVIRVSFQILPLQSSLASLAQTFEASFILNL